MKFSFIRFSTWFLNAGTLWALLVSLGSVFQVSTTLTLKKPRLTSLLATGRTKFSASLVALVALTGLFPTRVNQVLRSTLLNAVYDFKH